jgi:protein tyrosine phosphatase
MSKVDSLVQRLEYCKQVSSQKWIARCPAHEDRSPSLSIKELNDGRILIHCHAGCGANNILDSIGMEWGDLYPEDGNYSPVVKKREKDSYNEIVVAIANDYMKQGKRLTEAEKRLVINARLAG